MAQIFPQLFSMKEAATHLGISKSAIWRLIRDRKLASYKISGRILVSRTQLDEFLRASEIKTADVKRDAKRAAASLLKKKTKKVQRTA